MRKTFPLILTFIFLFNIGGYFLWFSIVQMSIKERIEQKIKSGLKEEDLSLIIVPINNKSGIQWIIGGKEFRYQGEMYDVVHSKIKGRQKYYYCINDHKEKQLIANYTRTHNTKREADKKLKNAFSDRYFPDQCFRFNAVYPSVIHYTLSDISFTSTIPKIPSPPPETA